jgi:phage baseplate assembly protein V
MAGGRMQGLVTGTVVDVDDPETEGKIRVNIETLSGGTVAAWAPVAAPMAGDDRGICFPPEIGDEVVLGFIADDPEQPVILGYTWNGQDRPPTPHPRQRIIRSKNGHTIRLIDETPGASGSGSVVIEDANGNTVTLSNGKIRLQAVALVEIDAPVVTISGPGWSRVISPSNTPI